MANKNPKAKILKSVDRKSLEKMQEEFATKEGVDIKFQRTDTEVVDDQIVYLAHIQFHYNPSAGDDDE